MSSPVRRRRGPDWLHPGWSWTVGRAWVITALSASVTLIPGAVLGALPALLVGSWSDPQTRFQTWVLIGFTVASLLAAVTAIVLYRKRRWVLHENGTAYVIRELASDWDRQDERVFLDSAGRYFARVIKVPGPGQLGQSWDWPLGHGARHWDGKIDELARSFPWHAIPSLVTTAADWIECKSAELAGHTVLLGATMLPEAALGLGITAGHAQRTRWPENMWPLVYRAATDSLVVPHLNLGTSAFRDREVGISRPIPLSW